MIKQLFSNWKTTGVGVLLAAGALVEIAYMIVEGNPVEKSQVNTVIAALLGGIGLLAAGDADKSQSKEDAKKEKKDTDTQLLNKQDVEDK